MRVWKCTVYIVMVRIEECVSRTRLRVWWSISSSERHLSLKHSRDHGPLREHALYSMHMALFWQHIPASTSFQTPSFPFFVIFWCFFILENPKKVANFPPASSKCKPSSATCDRMIRKDLLLFRASTLPASPAALAVIPSFPYLTCNLKERNDKCGRCHCWKELSTHCWLGGPPASSRALRCCHGGARMSVKTPASTFLQLSPCASSPILFLSLSCFSKGFRLSVQAMTDVLHGPILLPLSCFRCSSATRDVVSV